MVTKLCKDCKWCDDPANAEDAKCNNPAFDVRPTNGDRYYCSTLRRFRPFLFLGLFGTPIGCGSAGKYWEPCDGNK